MMDRDKPYSHCTARYGQRERVNHDPDAHDPHDRVFQSDVSIPGGWYYQSREGLIGPFHLESAARLACALHVTDHRLKNRKQAKR